MEKNSTTRHVAIVEKCVMTEMAWRYIFSREDNSQYRIHFFKNINLLRAVEAGVVAQIRELSRSLVI